MKAIAVLVVCLAVVMASAETDSEFGRPHKARTVKKLVKPRIVGEKDGVFMPKSRVIMYPKGQLPPVQAVEESKPAAASPEAAALTSPPVELTLTLQAARGDLCSTGTVNVRSKPATTGAIVFTMSKGEKITVTATTETSAGGYVWVPVSSASRKKSGYVAKSLVGPCGSSTTNNNNAPAATGAVARMNAPSYKQCGQSYSNDKMGRCSNTVCKSGCAISSIAMYLSYKGYSINPGALNKWLGSNGGYANGCDLVWSKPTFGKITFVGAQKPTYAQACGQIKAGNGVVLNVKGGGHYVLATGCDGRNVFYVNDPGSNTKNTYQYTEVVRTLLYR